VKTPNYRKFPLAHFGAIRCMAFASPSGLIPKNISLCQDHHKSLLWLGARSAHLSVSYPEMCVLHLVYRWASLTSRVI